MALTGKQKAAMLLMTLDSQTATELLRGSPAEDVQEIAMELAQLDASGQRDKKNEAKVIKEFYNLLRKNQNQEFSIKGFLNEMLVSIIGKEKAEQIQDQIRKVTGKKDLFASIRSANTDELVLALEGEHPQTVAVVLSELAPNKSQEVLSHLNEETRLKGVCKMTNLEMLRSGVKERIAFMVSERLKSFEGETLAEKPEQVLRKLAIILSGLENDLRDRLLDEINKCDEENCKMIKILMITWEDIPTIADRSLQEALRKIDAQKLAVALYGAEEEVIQKIRANISERVAVMLDEESSLMQEPLEKEILDAREEIVNPLREANEEGTLRRVQQQ
ncbi:MAG: FliG C-terminal domain-containing protein [Planctomycetota bacterium]|jgi:flagellar motor switch protein FliG